MSNTVDERIVEMRFENEQFEKGVNTSLKSLEKLKSGLDLEGAAKGLNNLQTSADKFDISGISDGVDRISQRFTALGIMADQAIRRITDSLFSLGNRATQTVKQLTIDQIPVGFDKYERKIQSVQTIMNATGKTIDEVNTNLDKLNWYTDETSYSFTDMVDNIGKFTSSNVPLETAVTSMIGIANAAGLAGASTQDASHAMEGFSKAIAQGYMSRQNWQWIRTAHMDTTKFKDTLIQAAVAEGTLQTQTNKQTKQIEYFVKGNKKAIVSIEDFESAMKDGWLTTNVMNSALDQFGGTTERIYEEFLETGDLTSDIIARMGDSADDLGLKAFRASQEAKTFTDAINSVKDAVSTGWMVSFEQIFGNYEEAKKLWTEVANELWDVFAGGAEERNDILKTWHDSGGYEENLESLRSIWSAIKEIGTAIKDTFSNIFPPATADTLLDLSHRVSEVATRIRDTFVPKDISEYSDAIKDLATGRFRELDGELVQVNNNQEKFAEIYGTSLKSVLEQNEKAKRNVEVIKDAFSGLFSVVKLVKVGFESLFRIVSPIKRIFAALGQSIFGFSGSLGKTITQFVDSIIASEKFSNTVSRLTEIVDNAVTFILRSVGAIKDFYKALKESPVVKGAINAINDLVTEVKNYISPYFNEAKDAVTGFFSSLFNNDNGETKARFIGWVESVILGIQSFIERAKKAGKTIKQYIKPYVDAAVTAFKNLYSRIKTNVSGFIDFWKTLKEGNGIVPFILGKIDEFKQKLIDAKDAALEFVRNFSFSGLLNKVKEALGPATEELDKWLKDTKKKLEDIDLGKLIAVGISLTLVPTIIAIGSAFKEAGKLFKTTSGFIGNLNGLVNKIKTGFKTTLMQTAEAVFVFAAAIGVLAGSFKLISTVPTEKVNSSIGVLTGIAGALTAMTAILGLLSHFKLLGDINKIGVAMIEMAGAIAILSGAFMLLDKANPKNIWTNLAVIVLLMGSLTGVALAVSTLGKKMEGAALILVSLSAGVLLLSIALEKVSKIDSKVLEQSFDTIVLLMTILGAIGLAGKSFKGFGLGMIGMVSSVLIIMYICKKIADPEVEATLKKAISNIGILATLIGSLVLMGGLTKLFATKNAAGFGAAILAMSASLLIVVEAVKRFAEIDTGSLIKGGIAVAAIIVFFGSFAKQTMYSGNNASKAGVAILAISGALMVVYHAIKMLGKMNGAVLGRGLIAVVAIFASFKGLLKHIGNVKGTTGPLLGLAAAIGVMVAAVAYLSLFSLGDLAKGVISLTLLMALLAVCLNQVGKIKFEKGTVIKGLIFGIATIAAITAAIKVIASENWASLLSSMGAIGGCLLALSGAIRIFSSGDYSKLGFKDVGVVIVAIGALYFVAQILKQVADQPWNGMLAAAGSISLTLVALVTAAGVFGKLASVLGKVDPGTFITGSLYMIGAIAAVGALFLGLSWLTEKMGQNGEIAAGAQQLGDAIGNFLGGIMGSGLGSAIEGFTSKLPGIGEDLSAFMESASGFFEGVAAVPPGVGDNILNLAKAMRSFSKEDGLVDNLGEWFSSKLFPDAESSTKQLETLGDTLKSFSTTCAQIDPEGLENGVKAADALNKLLGTIQPTTGLIGVIFGGDTKWSTLSDGLVEMSLAMQRFGAYSKDIKISDVNNGVAAAEKLNTLLGAIQPSSGWINDVFGGGLSWETISTGLGEFGKGLKKFSNKASDVSVAAVQNGVDAGIALNGLLQALPSSTGHWQNIFGGGVEWSNISAGLADFGQAISDFQTNVSGIENPQHIKDVIGSIASLPDTIISVGERGTNEVINSFGINLVNFGDRLRQFDEIIASVGAENIQNVITEIENIKKMHVDLDGVGEQLADSLTNSLNAHLDSSSATAVITNYVSNMTAGVFYNLSAFNEVGELIASAFSKGVESKASAAKNAGATLSKNTATGAGNLYSKMYSAGVNAALGFINGLLSKKLEAYLVGEELAGEMMEGADTKLRNGSPSKEMMKVGAFAGEGFVIGIKNSIPDVGRASANMANEALLTTAEAFKSFDDVLNSDESFNPVITPVLDLSQVESGSQRLNSMLNQNSAIRLNGSMNMRQERDSEMSEMLSVTTQILRAIQNGRNVYFDDGEFAGRIDRRLGAKI